MEVAMNAHNEYADARQELVRRQRSLLDRLGKIQAHTHRKDGPLQSDFAEQAVELENEEVLASLDVGTRNELLRIRAALDRIDAGKYGRCIGCGEKIAPKRLEALPVALHCMPCASRTGMS